MNKAKRSFYNGVYILVRQAKQKQWAFLLWCLESCSVVVSSVTQSCPTLCDCSTPVFPFHHQLPELAQTPVHRVGDAIQPFHSLSSPSSTCNLSQHQGLFQWVSSSHQVAKVLEFQLQHQPSRKHSGLISFRMDWLDLLAVRGTLRRLLQHHSSKASILWHSAFFMVQLSYPHDYWKNHSFD